MKSSCLLLVLAALPAGAWAQIGLTEKEAIARYGAPTTTGKHSTLAGTKVAILGPWLAFSSGRWSIRCDFVADRCVRLAYGDRGNEDGWTEADIQRVLAANAQGEKWVERPPERPEFHRRAWRRGDGATATFGEFTGLSIAIPDYQQARRAAGAEPTTEGWAGPGPLPAKQAPR